MNKLKVVAQIGVLSMLAGCSTALLIAHDVNWLKDHYCELPVEDRAEVLVKIRKVFPNWVSVCTIPDII